MSAGNTAAWVVLVALMVQASTAILYTNISLDVLKCVYRDWYTDTQQTVITGEELDANIKCCRSQLGNKEVYSFLRLDFGLIKYVSLLGDVNGTQHIGTNSASNVNCHVQEEPVVITTHELKDYVCNISEELGKLADLKWPKSIESDSLLVINDDVRRDYIDQMLHIYDRIIAAALTNQHCYILRREDFQLAENLSYAETQKMFEEFQNAGYLFMGKHFQIFSYALKVVEMLHVPYSYEKLRGEIKTEELDSWIKIWDKIVVWLHGRFRAYLSDNIGMNKEVFNANLIEDTNEPGTYKLRWPLPRVTDMSFGDLEAGRNDCWKCCDKYGLDLNETTKPLGDMEYAFYTTWLRDQAYYYVTLFLSTGPFRKPLLKLDTVKADDVWPLADQDNTTVSVDRKCVRLMKDLIDNPICLIDELPEETRVKQKRCRLQLESDLRQKVSASSSSSDENVSISLCLLSWMISNSNSICEDVPPSFATSPEAAFCFFNTSSDQACDNASFSNELCSASREILWFKCKKYVDNFFFLELNEGKILSDYKQEMQKIFSQ